MFEAYMIMWRTMNPNKLKKHGLRNIPVSEKRIDSVIERKLKMYWFEPVERKHCLHVEYLSICADYVAYMDEQDKSNH